MKITLVRGFVLALVVVGFSASSISSAAVPKTVSKVSTLGIVNTPTPMCRLNDKNGCGID
jgi:hypothetical protein